MWGRVRRQSLQRTLETDEPGALSAWAPGLFLLVAFEQDDFLMREGNFDSGLVQRFLDHFWHSEANVEPVFAFDEWTNREVDRTII